MKKYKKERVIQTKFFLGIIILIFFIIFYLRQQYVIIKLQKEINNLYEELIIEKNKNKELNLTFQQLSSIERLQNYAKKLNFVPVNQKDCIIIE
jgi:cell division protein FtsL